MDLPVNGYIPKLRFEQELTSFSGLVLFQMLFGVLNPC
jgi:hypothetical protein